MPELHRIVCPYGQCSWARAVMVPQLGEQLFDIHEQQCPWRQTIIDSSAGFFRCTNPGCDYVRFYSRGKGLVAEQHRQLHKRICPHQ